MKLTRSEAMKLRHSTQRVEGWLNAATAQDLADGLAPRDVQAAVWTVYRRTNARALYDLNGV